MEPKTDYEGALAMPGGRSDRGARAFVWGVWLIMMLVALICLARYGWNVPMTEDWLLVPPLTGNEPDLANWLWAQNNEHRIPLPRLMLLALLKTTNGDFRVGMLFNIVTLGLLAFAMIRVARYVRGGRTSFADAFFPITLLHLGNWENLFWSWQLSFVLPTALICALLLIIVSQRTPVTPGATVVGGTCLVLLPLCGLNGLVFVPPLALWFSYCGIRNWRVAKVHREWRWTGGFLIGSSVIALALAALYFVGYERPSWTPPNPGLGPTLKAAVKFLALGIGPVARNSWRMSAMAAISILLASGIVAVIGVLRNRGPERHRALGVLVFYSTIVMFAVGFGWGRAEVIPIYGKWPIRYVLLAVPAFYASFFIWELYGLPKIKTAVQYSFFVGMSVLIPFNTNHGFSWRDWYTTGMDALARDLFVGTPASVLAERHRQFLYHSWEPSQLADHMRMLREAGIGPFAQMQDDPPIEDRTLFTQEIRYHMPEAAEVFFVWGINGWATVPIEIRPTGTQVKNKIMHTPMVYEGETFVVKVHVPYGVMVDYGFLMTKKRSGDAIEAVWDGSKDYHMTVTKDDFVEVKTAIKLQ